MKTYFLKKKKEERLRTPLTSIRKSLPFLLVAALILSFVMMPVALAEVEVGTDPLNFSKPNLGDISTVTVNIAGEIPGYTPKLPGSITYYRILVAQYPVIAVKQGSNAWIVWKLEDGEWTNDQKTYASDKLKFDGSWSATNAQFYIGTDFNTAQKTTHPDYNANNYGNYFYNPNDGYFYIQKDKLSHFDWGADPNFNEDNYYGKLTIEKVLAGEHGEWFAFPDSMFQAKIKVGNQYMTVSGKSPNYTYAGLNNTGTIIDFSENSPAKISRIPLDLVYEIEEITSGHFNNFITYTHQNTIASGDVNTATITNTYDHYSNGWINLSKELLATPEHLAAWGVNDDTVYQVRIWEETGYGARNYLAFIEKPDNEYWCVANNTSYMFYDGPETVILSVPISVNKPVKLTNLWAYTGATYTVEELSASDWTVTYTYPDGDKFLLEQQDATASVTITNEYGDPNEAKNHLIIRKVLDGRYSEWEGVDADTEFTATVRNSSNRVLYFTKGADNVYTYTGTSSGGNRTSNITFSVNQPARLANLPTGSSPRYTVTETGGANYTISYEGNNAIFPSKGSITVTVTNTYSSGTGSASPGTLIIQKELVGDWPEEQQFEARIKYYDDEYLTFDGDGPEYVFTGISVTGDIVSFTDEQSAVITGIPEGFILSVEEIGDYNASYSDTNIEIISGANHVITVTNTADEEQQPVTGSLKVSKVLVGGNNADSSTPFTFIVTFSNQGTYDGVDSGSPFTLKGGESKTITGIPLGVTYTVTEAEVEGYTTESTGENGEITETQSEAVFTNTKDEDEEQQPATGSLRVSKVLAGGDNTDLSTPFTFTVTFTLSFSDEGTYDDFESGSSFTLKAGESKVITGIPLGVTYTVTEAVVEGYTTTSTGENGEITETQSEAIFTNTKNEDEEQQPALGSLNVSKILSGNNTDPNKNFTFIVTFSDEGNYGGVANGSPFTLKGGQNKKIDGIPQGVTYTVTETEANADGYKTTSTGASGEITDTQSEAVFTNAKSRANNDDTPRDNGGGNGNTTPPKDDGKEDPKSTVEEEVEEDDDNGDDGDVGNQGGTVVEEDEDDDVTQQEPERVITPRTPGGSNRDVPPGPNTQGNRIEPGDNGIYYEYADDNTPLGEWRWDEDEDLWVFDEYPPLAVPKTGDMSIYTYYFVLLGCYMSGLAFVLKRKAIHRAKNS